MEKDAPVVAIAVPTIHLMMRVSRELILASVFGLRFVNAPCEDPSAQPSIPAMDLIRRLEIIAHISQVDMHAGDVVFDVGDIGFYSGDSRFHGPLFELIDVDRVFEKNSVPSS